MVNYFSDTNNNYSIDYGLPVYASADWSIRRDALADRSVMAYRPVHKQPTLGVWGVTVMSNEWGRIAAWGRIPATLAVAATPVSSQLGMNQIARHCMPLLFDLALKFGRSPSTAY